MTKTKKYDRSLEPRALADIYEFLTEIYADGSVEYMLKMGKDGHKFCFEHYETAKHILRNNNEEKNVYLQVGEADQFDFTSVIRGTLVENIDIDLSYISVICIDIAYSDAEEKQKALELATNLSVLPSMIIDAGYSLQVLWKMQELLFWGLTCKSESNYKEELRVCSRVRAIHTLVSEAAAEQGLEVKPVVIDFCPEEQCFWLVFYLNIPGLVQYIRDDSGNVVKSHRVEIIWESSNDYMICDFDSWIGTKWKKESKFLKSKKK